MKFSVVLCLSVLASALLGVVLHNQGTLSEEPKELTYTLPEFPSSFDPAIAFDDYSLRVASQVLEPLYQYHYLKRPYEIEPLLAKAMPKVSEDGKTYRVSLKQNVLYHDHPLFLGKKRYVQAEDFVRQIKRLAFKPTKSKGNWIFKNRLVGFDEFSEKAGDSWDLFRSLNIKGLKAIDKYTLEFQLEKRDEEFIYYLTMNFVVPLPVEFFQAKNPNALYFGTGPFQLSSMNQSEIVFSQFEQYRETYYPQVGDRYAYTEDLLSSRKKKIPFLNTIVFKVKPDAKEQWESVLVSESDIVEAPKEFVSPYILDPNKRKKDLDGVKLDYSPSLSARWLAFNMKDETVGGQNKKLRLAIAHAIDRREYIRQIKKNTCLEAQSIYNPGILGYDPSFLLPFEFNLDKARELLAQAGFPDGKNLPVITYSTRSDSEINKQEALLIQSQLAQIGIRVRVNILKWKEFLSKSRRGELQFWTGNWIYDYPDAGNLLQLLYSKNHPGNNKTAYSNSIVDESYLAYLKSRSNEEKIRNLSLIQQQVTDDLPWIMMIYETNYVLRKKRVSNFRYSSIIRNYLKYINLK